MKCTALDRRGMGPDPFLHSVHGKATVFVLPLTMSLTDRLGSCGRASPSQVLVASHLGHPCLSGAGPSIHCLKAKRRAPSISFSCSAASVLERAGQSQVIEQPVIRQTEAGNTAAQRVIVRFDSHLYSVAWAQRI